MKRLGNIYDKICDIDNIKLAHKKASKGKSNYKEVKIVNNNYDYHINQIRYMLVTESFNTSQYKVEEIFDGRKNRIIHKLPYYPDRIVHHCIMNYLEPYFIKSFIRDTFQSIKGRGTTDAYKRVKRFIRNKSPKYALKIDINKYYPSVDNDILFNKIQKKIKCKRTLGLLENIIYSSEGLPIGNYTSQYLGNFYLNEFDWFIKQKAKPLGYFRYCDDMLFFSDSTDDLLNMYYITNQKLLDIKLNLKNNYNIYNIQKEGVDFVGYVFGNDSIRLRRSIRINMYDKITNNYDRSENTLSMLMSYKGWASRCNCKVLYRSLLNSFHYKVFNKQLSKNI